MSQTGLTRIMENQSKIAQRQSSKKITKNSGALTERSSNTSRKKSPYRPTARSKQFEDRLSSYAARKEEKLQKLKEEEDSRFK